MSITDTQASTSLIDLLEDVTEAQRDRMKRDAASMYDKWGTITMAEAELRVIRMHEKAQSAQSPEDEILEECGRIEEGGVSLSPEALRRREVGVIIFATPLAMLTVWLASMIAPVVAWVFAWVLGSVILLKLIVLLHDQIKHAMFMLYIYIASLFKTLAGHDPRR